MSRYDNVECPVCEKKFIEGDDVVVCPVCGAPHHRTCYQAEGKCHFESEHESGMQWEERNRKKEQEEHKDDPKKCPKCSAPNPPDGIFCQVCGYPMRNPAPQNDDSFAPPPINMMAFTTPYGGINPEEEIDGVTAKELALFVGENSFYYVPRMRSIKKNQRSASWNWSAFIFNFAYYFNRKMWVMGAIMLALYILSMVPSFVFAYHLIIRNPDVLTTGMTADVNYLGLESLVMASNIARYIYTLICFVSGLFANKIYTTFAYNKIKEIREQLGEVDKNSPEYANALSREGRTNHALGFGSILAVVAMMFIIAMVITYLVTPYIF